MERVLVLDQSYLPISIVSWQRAICYIAQEKVEVVKEYDHRIIRSARASWKLPAVVRFVTKFIRPRKLVKFSRQNVFVRDKWRCQYCGVKFKEQELTYDHVKPKSLGGKTEWENIVTCCISCNTKKGSKTPREVGFKVRRAPSRPDWTPIFAIKLTRSENIPEDWRAFCYGL